MQKEPSLGGDPVVEEGDVDVFWWMVNLDYNILTGPITPFVTGGIGLGYYSMEVEARNVTTGATARGSDDDTQFIWNLGVGGRWDITNNIFIKALYKITWDEDEDWDGLAVHAGYMF